MYNTLQMGKEKDATVRDKDMEIHDKDVEIHDKDVEIQKLAAALGDSKSQPYSLHGTHKTVMHI